MVMAVKRQGSETVKVKFDEQVGAGREPYPFKVEVTVIGYVPTFAKPLEKTE